MGFPKSGNQWVITPRSQEEPSRELLSLCVVGQFLVLEASSLATKSRAMLARADLAQGEWCTPVARKHNTDQSREGQ